MNLQMNGKTLNAKITKMSISQNFFIKINKDGGIHFNHKHFSRDLKDNQKFKNKIIIKEYLSWNEVYIVINLFLRKITIKTKYSQNQNG